LENASCTLAISQVVDKGELDRPRIPRQRNRPVPKAPRQPPVDQLFNSTEKRLARALLLLARYGKEDKPQALLPKISQEVLAEMIGATRSRVNVFMNRFKKQGFIKYNGGLQINTSLRRTCKAVQETARLWKRREVISQFSGGSSVG
jgi:Crp-like helix-turn-helix domain